MPSKVLRLHPQVKQYRRTGPDYRVNKADVESLMQGKLLVPKINNQPGHNSVSMTKYLPL